MAADQHVHRRREAAKEAGILGTTSWPRPATAMVYGC